MSTHAMVLHSDDSGKQAAESAPNSQEELLGLVNSDSKSIDWIEKQIEQTPQGHPDLSKYLLNLGEALKKRYLDSGDLKDMARALQSKQDALALISSDHPARAVYLQDVALLFGMCYQRLGNLPDLEEAVQKFQEAVDMTPADHPHRPDFLQKLALAFTERYRRLGDMKDLEAALQCSQEAVDLTPPDHPDRATHLQSLAMSFKDRYERLGELKDLQIALQSDQEALALTPRDHPDRAEFLRSLAHSLKYQYQRFGYPEDLETALQYNQAAVDLTSADHPNRAMCLQGLAISLINRYQLLGNLTDLEAALLTDEEALDLIPLDDPDRADQLHNLGYTFRKRFERDQYKRLTQLKDLEAALENFQEAMTLTPSNHPDRVLLLQNLAVSFSDRYQRLGDVADLEAALKSDQEAVDLLPADHPSRAGHLSSLAFCFRFRYRRFGNLKDLEEALHKDQEAVDLTPLSHPDKALYLRNLTASLGARYLKLKDLKDLESTIQRAQEALDLSPADHPNRAELLQVFASSLMESYHIWGDWSDLETALQRQIEALDLTLPDHSDRAKCLQSLALTFCERFRKTRDQEDLQAVHKWYSDSFQTQAFPSDPELSWNAALQWASFSEEFDPLHCPTAYLAAFNLLPALLWIGHTIPLRHDKILRLEIGHIASAATRTCIGLSDLTSAVEIMEQALGTIFQQMLQLKTNMDIIPPEQAEDLQKLSYELYSGTATDPQKTARRRSDLLDEIRRQPGLQYFLRPQPYNFLSHASQQGPVIILNSHKYGCDGIIIPDPSSKPVHVPFPNITLDELKSQQTSLKELLSQCNVRTRGDSAASRLFGSRERFTSKTTNECFAEMLAWLWTHVTDPVYQTLNSLGIHSGRVWWLPTGAFTGLPLHASAPTDQFIHSYTATLNSLLEAYAKKTSNIEQKLGVVGVTHTGPRQENNLKGVEQEVQQIGSVVPHIQCLEGEQATPDAVKHQLQSCSWVHLACHGKQDLVHPTKSYLLLYEGTLELETILKMPLPNAEFVFLAACQTAMGDSELINESFHLGGGFIAAGFRGAIGTLWSMNDTDGPLVARSVYSHLFHDHKQPQASEAAEALQLAVEVLKASNVEYERWIPFIHLGV
ncbi:CHAT domain-containing protein [Mycena galopus ATCC 62051]|nr:CHAT domain-containing protein [Mycena galopus ATCC 62051]